MPNSPGEVDLAEAGLTKQPFDFVFESRFRTGDDVSWRKQWSRAIELFATSCPGAGRGGRCVLDHTYLTGARAFNSWNQVSTTPISEAVADSRGLYEKQSRFT